MERASETSASSGLLVGFARGSPTWLFAFKTGRQIDRSLELHGALSLSFERVLGSGAGPRRSIESSSLFNDSEYSTPCRGRLVSAADGTDAWLPLRIGPQMEDEHLIHMVVDQGA